MKLVYLIPIVNTINYQSTPFKYNALGAARVMVVLAGGGGDRGRTPSCGRVGTQNVQEVSPSTTNVLSVNNKITYKESV